MRLWFDEDLSPTLVTIAHERGFEAACNRDRGVLGATDRQLRDRVQREGFVLVTDNASDFRPMYSHVDAHPGLIVLPGGHGRASQQQLAGEVIDWIAAAAQSDQRPPADFMVNRLVEIDHSGAVTTRDLP